MINTKPYIFLIFLFTTFIVKSQTAKIWVNNSIQTKGSTLALCQNQNFNFIDSSSNSNGTRNWIFKSGTPNNSNAQNILVSFNTAGTDTVFLISNGAIPDTTFLLILVKPRPLPSYTFTNNICAGTNVTFTNTSTGSGVLTYNWSFGTGAGAPANSTNTSPTVVYTPNIGSGTINYTVNLQITSDNGCNNSLSQPINIKQLPDASVIADPFISNNFTNIPNSSNPTLFRKCNLVAPHTIEISTNSNTSNSSYTIDWGDLTSQYSSSNFSLNAIHIYTSLGPKNLTATFTGANGCSSSKTYQVYIGTNPAVSMPAPPNTTGQCIPQTYTFNIGGVSTNTSGTTYKIESNDKGVDTTFNHPPPISYTKDYNFNSCGFLSPNPYPNSFYLKITAINPCGSTTQTVEPIQLSSKPIANFIISPDSQICVTQNITLTNSSIGGRYIDPGQNTVTPGFCDTTSFKHWQITPSTGWSLVSGIMAGINATNSLTLSFSNRGLYTGRLVIFNPNSPCGRDTVYKSFCVQAVPVPNFGFSWGNGTRCAPVSLNFNNTSDTSTICGNTNYAWTVTPNGGTNFIGGTNSNSKNPQIQFLNAGTFTVRLSITNKCGTVFKDTAIIIKGPPIVQLPTDKNYCDTLTIAFNPSNTSHNPNFGANGGSITSYNWTVSPTGYFFVGGTNANSQFPIIRFTQSGNYKIKVTASNECGTLADSQMVNIWSPVGMPLIRDTFFCGPSSFTLSGLLGLNGTTLRWYNDSTTSTILSTGLSYNTALISTSRSFYISTYNAVTGCESYRLKINITIRTIPTSPTGLKLLRCGPSSVSLTATVGANGNKLKWYTAPTGGTPIFVGNPFITPVLNTTTVFFVSSYDSVYGCESTSRFADTVIINPLPTIYAGNDTSFCNLPGTVNLTGTPTGGIWSGPGVNASGVFTPISVGIGVYNIIYTYTNPITTCLNSDTLTVSVVGATLPNAGTDTSLCKSNNTITFQGSPSGGTWSGSSNITLSGVFNPTTAGTYTLIYATGAGSCLARDTLSITVKPLPQPNFNLANGICPNQSLILSATNGNAISINSYRWFVSATKSFPVNIIGDSSLANTSILFPENQTSDTVLYRIKLRLTSSDGCIDSITKNIVLNKRPNAQFNANGSGCGPSPITVANTSTNSPTSWNWFIIPSAGVNFTPSATVGTPNIIFPINNTPSTINYKLYLNATVNGIGTNCSDLDSSTIPIYPKPFVGFTNNQDSGCTPLMLSFDNKSDPKNGQSQLSMSFAWKLNNQLISTDTIPADLIILNGFQKDSLVNLKLIGSTIHGCSDSVTKTITIFPNAKASFSFNSSSSCAPFLIGTSNVNINSFPLANSSYLWQYLNPTTKTILVSATGNAPPNYTISNPNDSVLLRLVAFSLKGCKSDTFEQLFRTISNPVAGFMLSDTVGCSGISINFINQSSSGVTLNWIFSSGVQSGSSNPTILFTSSSNTADTLHWAKLIITAGGTGCKDSITKTFRILPRPLSVINSITNQYCSNQTISLNAASLVKLPATFSWTKIGLPSVSLIDTNLNIVKVNLPNNQGASDSTFSLRLRTTSTDGCFSDTVINVTVLRRPLTTFTLPFNLCYSGNVIPLNQTSNINSNQLSWMWSTVPSATSITTVTDKEPIISLPSNNSPDSIIYNIRLITERQGAGCKDTLIEPITVYPKPFPLFTASIDSSCTPLIVSFDNKSIAKNGEPFESMNFKWFINGTLATQDSVLPNQTFINSTQKDSIILIKLIATSKHGCSDSLTKTLVIHPNAKAQFATTRILSCAPFLIDSNVINTIVYSSANSAYHWFVNNTLVSNSLKFSGFTIVNPDDSVTIKLVTTSLYGCLNDTMSLLFKTIPNPTPNFVPSDTIGCMPLNVQMNNTSNPINGLTYLWKVGQDTSTLKHPVFNLKNYGINDTVVMAKLIVIAGNTGCKDSLEQPITIKPLPQPSFNFTSAAYCYPNAIIISNNSASPPSIKNGSYKWRAYGQGLIISNDSSNSSLQINYPDNQTGLSKNAMVSLTISSDFGCIDSVIKTTIIPTRPVANFAFNRTQSCAFDTLGITNSSNYSSTYQWYSTQNNLVISNPNIENPNVKGLNSSSTLDSTYHLKLIAINNFGCKDSILKPIVINPKPSTTITLNKSMGCAPLLVSFNQLTFSKPGNSYSWLLEKGISGNGDSISHSFIGSEKSDTIYLVKLIAISIDGCMDTSQTTVIAKAGAKADLLISDSIYCMNQNFGSVFITNTSYGNVDTFFYNFGDTTYLITKSDTAFSHKYFNEGKYKLTLKATNLCKTSFDSAEFKILNKPIPNFSLSDSIGCSPLKVYFKNQTNSFDATYFWNFGNGITSNLKQPDSITFYQSKLFDTTYLINLSASNFCGITNLQDTVRVLPIPVANFIMSADSGCSPLPVSFLNTTTGLPSYIKWDFGNGDTSKRYNPYPTTFRTEDSTTVYKIKLVASNLCGIDSITKNVKVEPNSVRAFFTTSGNTGCAPLTVKFNNMSIGGTYVGWDFGNGQTSSNNNPQITYQNSGMFTAYLYVNNGCSYDTAKVIINVLKVPDFSISTSQRIACMREPISFNANLIDSGSIIWHLTANDSFEQKSISFSYANDGLKPFFVRLKSATNFCSKTIFDTISINPLPVISLNVNALNQCYYKPFILNNNGSTLSNVFYTWLISDGNSYTGNAFTHQFNNAGTYQIKLKGVNNYGCIDSSQTNIIAYPKPIAKFDYTPKDTCIGPVTVTFSNQSQGAAAYLWSFGNSFTSQLTNPTTFYAGVGTYPISLIANNEFNCFDTFLAEYHIYNMPKSDFTYSANNGCEPLEINFQSTSTYGNSWLWDFGDGHYSTQESPTHTYLKSGLYDVRLTVIEGGLCRDSVTMNKLIEVHAKPTASFNALLDSTVRPYSVMIFTNQSLGSMRYLWMFDDNTTSTESNPIHKFKIWGEHSVKLIVYSDKNCADTIESLVYIPEYKKGLFVPNAFTPDYGQPEVMVFKPVGVELKSYHIQVLDKWGELMWESDKIDEYGRPTEWWDGKDKNGVPCLQGSYVWIIKAQHTDGVDWEGMVYPTGSRKPVTSGNVTLIR